MKILIIAPKYSANSTDVSYDYTFPLGLSYISASLKAAGYDVHCLNPNHYEGTVETLLQGKIRDEGGYDYILTGGISIEYKRVRNVVNAIRTISPESKLILGGGLISSEPELMFNALDPDYIVIGEGDRTIVELIAALELGSSVDAVPGIGYRGADGRFVCTQTRDAIMELDSLPWPDYDGFEYEKKIDNNVYNEQTYDQFDEVRMYCITGSRSCPFKCTFCFHPLGPKYRQRGLDSIMAELEERVRRYRANMIVIYDELFAYKRERVVEFCHRIKQFIDGLGWQCNWFCALRVNNVDDELLGLMKASGCFAISFGIESYSAEVLMSMKKGIKPEMIDKAVELMRKHKLTMQGNLIFGDTAETPASIRESLGFWRKHNYLGLGLGFIQPYPGSAIYNYCIANGLITDKLDFIENHLLAKRNMSRTLTEIEFQSLIVEVDITLRRDMLVSVPESISPMPNGLYRIDVECPDCGELNVYRNRKFVESSMYSLGLNCRSCKARFVAVSRMQKIVNAMMAAIYAIMPRPVIFHAYILFKRLKYGSSAKA